MNNSNEIIKLSPSEMIQTEAPIKITRWTPENAKTMVERFRELNHGIGSPESGVAETSKDEAGVGLKTVVRPIVEVAEKPQVQRAQRGRGTLFEPAPDESYEFEAHEASHDKSFDRIDPNPTVVNKVPPGWHCEATGSYVSGGGGSWSYNITSLPVFIGQVRMAPVAPYGGTRGIHFRRWKVESISLVPGGGQGSLRDA